MKQFSLILSVIVFLSSCGKQFKDISILDRGIQISSSDDDLNIQFLGTACFLIEYNGTSVLTDPFISNPPFRKSSFSKIKPNVELIHDYLDTGRLANTQMVVVGHGHYDHILDYPYLVQFMPDRLTVAASQTSVNMISSVDHQVNLVPVNQLAASEKETGRWIYSSDNSCRIMAIHSDHPPHFGNRILYDGHYGEPLNEVPVKGKKWLMGEPFSYLIDFLDASGKPLKRILFQSSRSFPPLGLFPEKILKEKSVDVAILSIAAIQADGTYPDPIIDFVNPGVIFLCHYENFWRKKQKMPKTAPKTDAEETYKYLQQKYGKDKRVIMPYPGAHFDL